MEQLPADFVFLQHHRYRLCLVDGCFALAPTCSIGGHSLLKLVGQRRRMLDYLKDRDIESYRDVINRLGLRR